MTVPALVGPTAVGKTDLSILLARRWDAEIISLDSRQIYRGMDIGTAKVAAELRASVPHHGLDVIAPGESYSAGRFAREARRWISEIGGRGRIPLLVGGTGFFLRALTNPVFREPDLDRERRSRLRAWLSRQPREELARWVEALDPARAPLAEAGGGHRLSRSLEIPLLTGRSLTWWHRRGPADAEPLDVRVVLLTLPREVLYRRIDERTEAMFRAGLLDEVRGLLEAGCAPGDPGMTATGYREAAAVVLGDLDLDEAVERVKARTRGYARRQLTWFRNQLPAATFQVDATEPLEALADRITQWWEGTGADRKGVGGA